MAQAELADLTDDPITLAFAMERIDELRNRLDVTERALDISADAKAEYEKILVLAVDRDIPADLRDLIAAVLSKYE